VHPQIMWAKLEALVEGARLASKELWRRSPRRPAPKRAKGSIVRRRTRRLAKRRAVA
jgi:5-methyltetrahydropteroyltriglutamate--homocysteine methyltransferase